MLLLFCAVVVAGVLGSLTDWLFMGLLFHGAYNRYPEVWRSGIAAGADKNAIVLSAAIGFVMTTAIVALCYVTGVASVHAGVVVAALAWIAGPLAVMVVNGLFIKLDVRIIAAHSIGYLMRLVFAGIAAGMALANA